MSLSDGVRVSALLPVHVYLLVGSILAASRPASVERCRVAVTTGAANEINVGGFSPPDQQRESRSCDAYEVVRTDYPRSF